jgi:hypothetical protein
VQIRLTLDYIPLALLSAIVEFSKQNLEANVLKKKRRGIFDGFSTNKPF